MEPPGRALDAAGAALRDPLLARPVLQLHLPARGRGKRRPVQPARVAHHAGRQRGAPAAGHPRWRRAPAHARRTAPLRPHRRHRAPPHAAAAPHGNGAPGRRDAARQRRVRRSRVALAPAPAQRVRDARRPACLRRAQWHRRKLRPAQRRHRQPQGVAHLHPGRQFRTLPQRGPRLPQQRRARYGDHDRPQQWRARRACRPPGALARGRGGAPPLAHQHVALHGGAVGTLARQRAPLRGRRRHHRAHRRQPPQRRHRRQLLPPRPLARSRR